MKTISALLLISVVASFRPKDSANAVVQKIQGVDVFVYSTPSRDYEVIERGIIGFAPKCEMVIEKSARKAADLNCNAVIVEFPARYVAIKYKD